MIHITKGQTLPFRNARLTKNTAVPLMTCLASRTPPPWPVVNTYRGCVMVKLDGKNKGKFNQQSYERLWAFKWEDDVVAIYTYITKYTP